ncbi:MAG TPA: penicillin acylase family protein [Egibacteraceae bacterium]|nr:penicillin acylase family protein [Egibacteraceae bacterium]
MRRLVAAVSAVLLLAAVAPATAQSDSAPTGSVEGSAALAAKEVRIIRDGFGVPHVYGPDAASVAYGAGYAIAQDRLFQMDVLRAVGKGRLTEIFGPVPGFPESDAATRRLFYTDAERLRKLARMSPRLRSMYAAYVDGVNAWMDEVRSDPSKLPQEYTQLGLGQPAPWDVTDSLAIAEMLVETFGAGGGSELQQAELLKHLQGQYLARKARRAFDDIRWLNDPASPTSIPKRYAWEKADTYTNRLPAKRWRRDARLGLTSQQRKPGAPVAEPAAPAIGTAAQAALVPDAQSRQAQQQVRDHMTGLEKARELIHFGSNAFITGPKRTRRGGTLQLGGPQVGQFAPQIVAEFGLHAPADGLNMTGLTFAGSGPAVLIGRTPHFAWTTTTGNSDGADIYVEQLGPEPETYVYEGRVHAMDCRDEQIRTRNGAPHSTERVCRTHHGPVIATDEDNGVAYSIRRSWFDREEGTIEGFFGANFVKNIRQFATSINRLQSNHNMFYVDAKGNYGYWHPGAIPIRAKGTDVRLPQDGRVAASEWVRLRTAQEMPHAVNFGRQWLANWNNKPAKSWDNGDAANYGVVYHSRLWNRLLAGEDRMSFARGNRFNRINATTELEFEFFRKHIVRAARSSDDPQIRKAGQVLARWNARRQDRDGDGKVDSEPGYSLWKGWRNRARTMAFSDELGSFTGRTSSSMLRHVLDGKKASLVKHLDWLNGEHRDVFLNRVMRANLDALASEYGTDDMSQWRAAMPTQHYTRLNVRFYDCEVARAAGNTTGCDDQLPGNVRSLDYMNRGTYNHLVEFIPRPGASAPAGDPFVEPRRRYRVRSGSIISPGQSGFINQAGQQSPHYEDQHELYAGWQYKPMPTRARDVRRLGDGSVTVLTYTPAS